MGSAGSLDFLLGKAIEEEEFRLLVLPHLKTLKGPSPIYEKLLEAITKEDFSLDKIMPEFKKDVLLLAVTLSLDYASTQHLKEQIARKKNEQNYL